MINFLTLLLGLVVGVHPVEVAVSEPVTKVELLLDGVKAGESLAAPWRVNVDFGTALEPHELVARALDAAGATVAEASQWINLPRPEAEVEIALEKQPAAARLAWQSSDNSAPVAISLHLDGQPLTVDASRRAALPNVDLSRTHVLSAEVQFDSGAVARRDVSLGGSYGAELSTELSAVPLRVSDAAGRKLSAPALQGRLVSGSDPLAVSAVEEGPANVIVVTASNPAHLHERYFPSLLAARGELRIRADTRVSLVSPGPSRVKGPDVAADLFDTTPAYERTEGGLLFLMAVTSARLFQGAAELRTVDAVAVAGLLAAAENRRRAVVFVLPDTPKGGKVDASRFKAQQVRQYLASLGVPLHVWNPARSGAGANAKAWGTTEDVSTLPKLRRAFDRLNEDLESQRIALVEGRHLLRAIQIKPGEPAVQQLGSASAAHRD